MISRFSAGLDCVATDVQLLCGRLPFGLGVRCQLACVSCSEVCTALVALMRFLVCLFLFVPPKRDQRIGMYNSIQQVTFNWYLQ
jgi:hypothetical protein